MMMDRENVFTINNETLLNEYFESERAKIYCEKENIKSIYFFRTLEIYIELIKNNSEYTWVDLVSAFKDMILFNNNLDFCINTKIYNEFSRYRNHFGLLFTKTTDENYLVKFDYTKFDNYTISMLKKTTDLNLKQGNPVIADNFLVENFGFEYYTSIEQKIAVDYNLNLRNGKSLLVVLPTGKGKSLVFKTPLFFEAGLSILIVPTVSLAIDQNLKLDKLANISNNVYYSGLESKEKKEIISNLKNDKLDILVISPEGLLGKNIKNLIIDLAKRKLISRFIFDEAHLIVDWGNFFRVEYQLIADFWKKLKKDYDPNIKTLFLTATIDDFQVDKIRSNFNLEDDLIQIRADNFRRELNFYIHRSKDKNNKANDLIAKALILAKPMIIYLDRLDEIDRIYDKLIEIGYSENSLKKFTSRTKQRLELINNWKEDKIDIIIASSAFGIGVDKPNIRTIIQGYIPENISRLYQEAGRAGRDRFSAVSYLSYNSNQDFKIANFFVEKVISAENALVRWKSMFSSINKIKGIYFIDCNTVPTHLKYTSEKNRSWNIHLILKLKETDRIEIIDFNQNYILEMKIKDPKLLNKNINVDYFENILENDRHNFRNGYSMIKKYLKKENCLSEYVNEINTFYPADNCLSCDYCRENDISVFFRKQANINIVDSKKHNSNTIDSFSTVFQLKGYYFKKILEKKEIERVIDSEIDCIISSDVGKNFLKLKNSSLKKVTLIDFLEFDKYPTVYFNCFKKIGIIITKQNDYKIVKKIINQNLKPIIIVEKNYYVPEESRYARDLFNSFDPISMLEKEDLC